MTDQPDPLDELLAACSVDDVDDVDETPAIDTANRQFVGVVGSVIGVIQPARLMSRQQALTHAAWLVVLAEALPPYDGPTFEHILAAVRRT